MGGLGKFISRAFGIGGGTPNIVLPATPTRADPAVEEARRRELQVAGKLQGAGANLLSGSAFGDTARIPAAVKTLLGQ